MLNNHTLSDQFVRSLLTGKDGRLFVEIDGAMVFLAEVNTFNIAVNITNTDYQPCGSGLSVGVYASATCTLTFTEAVIRDDITVMPIIDALNQGYPVNYTFQGSLSRYDNQEQRVLCRNAIPDGTFNLMNITPGEVVQREQTYRVNSFPELLAAFGYSA